MPAGQSAHAKPQRRKERQEHEAFNRDKGDTGDNCRIKTTDLGVKPKSLLFLAFIPLIPFIPVNRGFPSEVFFAPLRLCGLSERSERARDV